MPGGLNPAGDRVDYPSWRAARLSNKEIVQMLPGDYEGMDEYYWERELRRDDSRMNTLMKEIPSVLDLPGEDELLVSRLEKHPEHVRDAGAWYADIMNNFYSYDDCIDEDFNEDQDDDSEEWAENDNCMNVYCAVDKLMRQWCRIYAAEKTQNGLYILCHYGILVGFALDLVDFADPDAQGMTIAFSKRILKGVNEIITCIDSEVLSSHREGLLNLRQMVANLRFNKSKA